MTSTSMRVGTEVRLVVPENPRLHGASGVVAEITEWGAHVTTLAAATGQFRALYEEMVEDHKDTNGAGYTGNTCVICGSVRMIRNGTCELCQDCGSTNGCG